MNSYICKSELHLHPSSSSSTLLGNVTSASWLWEMDPVSYVPNWWLWEKGPSFQDQLANAWGISCISYLAHKANTWVWSKVNFLVGPQELLLGTIKRMSMLPTTTASLKPTFGAPWSVANAMVGTENAEMTMPKSGHPCKYQNCLLWLPEGALKRIAAESSIMPPKNPLGYWTELIVTNESLCF